MLIQQYFIAKGNELKYEDIRHFVDLGHRHFILLSAHYPIIA